VRDGERIVGRDQQIAVAELVLQPVHGERRERRSQAGAVRGPGDEADRRRR
jgi:hypothetical protein